MLRRRSEGSTRVTPPDAPSPRAGAEAPEQPSGKGRPTPKRKEAEAARRRPVVATPSGRRGGREDARRRRSEARAALENNDESRMPRRDRGPVRRFARDYVDSRRTVSEYFLPLGVLLYLVMLAVPGQGAKNAASVGLVALLLALALEMVRLGVGLSRGLRQRFPSAEERRGAVLYGLTRAGQMRRLRLPRPQVGPGGRPTGPGAGRRPAGRR